MNKKVFGRKLSRSRPAREALFTSLAKALIGNGKIVTTRAKAKAFIPNVEKMVTLAKKGDVNAVRKVLSMLDNSRKEVGILFGAVSKAFSERSSGFTRITSLPRRIGDNAEMVRVEWTEKMEMEKEKKEKKESKGKKEKETEIKSGAKSQKLKTKTKAK